MQLCPRCNTQNRNAAKFCANCAFPFTSTVVGGTGLLTANATLQERYVIVRKLGQGGFGAVYQAQDLHLAGKQWAIKELTPALITDPSERQDAVKALRHEFELLSQLNHPSLPRVADLFEENGNQYLVMDYVEGRTLEEVVASARSFLPEAQVLPWIDQLCGVLTYLHTRTPPIIFRDLKPANIMLESNGAIKLIDFGIARLFQPGKKKDTAAYGTMGYASPEQFGSGQTDARSDIYSLGVTLHHLLTRFDPAQSPFNLPSARLLNPSVSVATDQVIARATRSSPNERYKSASEMGLALRANAPTQPFVVPDAIPKTTPVARQGSWNLLIGIGVAFALIAGCALLALGSPALQTAFAPPATATRTLTATPDADAVATYGLDLYTGPGYFYDLAGSVGAGQKLKILNRDPKGTHWVLVSAGAGKQGWIVYDQVQLNISVDNVSVALQIPATPTSRPSTTATLPPRPTSTPIPPPPPTAAPPKFCPPNPVYEQINNFLDTGLVIEFSGPTTANVYVPPNGSVRLCLGQGMYTYTSRAIGYTTQTNTKLFTQDSANDCYHWDWWPASGVAREGACSFNHADYYAP